MKKELKELIWDECNRANNFIEIPAIYRHFKEVKDGEDMTYAVSNISVPISSNIVEEINMKNLIPSLRHKKSEIEVLTLYHTELNGIMFVYRKGDKYYHNELVEKEKLVIYTGLYGDRQTFVRPLPMFLSPVDKVKYPDAKQKFRLERVL